MQPVDDKPASDSLGDLAQCRPFRADIGEFALHHKVAIRKREGNRSLVKTDPRIGAQCVAHMFE
jgi:hypothetical protein